VKTHIYAPQNAFLAYCTGCNIVDTCSTAARLLMHHIKTRTD